MSISQRRKGAAGEREVCSQISEAYGRIAQRNLNQTREGGVDINLAPYGIEVKRRKRMAFYEWIHQAERACGDAATPVVVARADGEKWVAIISLDVFLKLAREDVIWERVKPDGCE